MFRYIYRRCNETFRYIYRRCNGIFGISIGHVTVTLRISICDVTIRGVLENMSLFRKITFSCTRNAWFKNYLFNRPLVDLTLSTPSFENCARVHAKRSKSRFHVCICIARVCNVSWGIHHDFHFDNCTFQPLFFFLHCHIILPEILIFGLNRD